MVEPAATLETIVDRLAASADPSGSLTILVTGEKTKGALSLALTAARRLSQAGRTALVDFGLSQPWLGDVFDHAGEPDHAHYGLADLLEGRASFTKRCIAISPRGSIFFRLGRAKSSPTNSSRCWPPSPRVTPSS